MLAAALLIEGIMGRYTTSAVSTRSSRETEEKHYFVMFNKFFLTYARMLCFFYASEPGQKLIFADKLAE